MRLYPDKIPHRLGEADTEKFEIVADSEFGKCIKSLGYFEIGQLVALIHTDIILKKAELHTAQISKDIHIYDPWFAGLISHSCEPNLIFDTNIPGFFAVKKILPGDILNQDYELTEDDLYIKFDCKCGSPHCRGKIKGKIYK